MFFVFPAPLDLSQAAHIYLNIVINENSKRLSSMLRICWRFLDSHLLMLDLYRDMAPVGQLGC